MTGIDPTDFVKQGKPTIEQVQHVWDTTTAPSARKVAEIMQRRGFEISWRSVARYNEKGWKHRTPSGGKRAPIVRNAELTAKQADNLAKERVRDAKLAQRPSEELMRAIGAADEAITPEAPPEAERVEDEVIQNSPDPSAKVAGRRPAEPMTLQQEEELLADRIRRLSRMSEHELREQEAKARVIFNIVLMEASARRANVMRLIPKDVAPLIAAMGASAGAARSKPLLEIPPEEGGTMQRNGDQAKVIDHEANNVSSAIAAFKRKTATV